MPDENPQIAIEPRALGARIREAREARSWTQQQTADRLGMARTTIVALEKGERRLKPQELVALAAVLGRSVSDLLQRGAPTEGFAVQLREVDENLTSQIEEFQDLCEDYVRLEEICQAPLRRHDPPEYDVQGIDPDLAAEDVASSERSRLGLGEGPVLNLREVLETDVGLRIFQMDLPLNLAGMFVYTARLGGCIAVNLQHPPERRRVSLSHELGHFLTARHCAEITLENRYERRPAGERLAEAFTRAFLIPASGLRRRYLDLERERSHGMTQGDLYRLAHFFAVPVEVMVRRLEELRLIPAGVRAVQQTAGLDSVDVDQEPCPTRYIALAVEAWQRAEISEGQLARFLRTDRIGAREKIQRFAEQNDSIDFGAPLLRAAGR